MRKIFFAVSMLCVFMLSLCMYTDTITNDLKNNIIRLHILARSNSDYDQKIKLAVRDEVIEAVSDIPITDTEKFIAVSEKTANEYLKANSIPYRAKAEYGTFTFPRKSYGNISLPAGQYRGVRILLDNGNGKNWWCVMYPPLCVTEKADEASEALKQSLNSGTYEVITKKPEVRFKILELLSQII
ncbi:MAG: stage II sporulation protein R [Clostridia bacterium]|nr:stage II sporulation protein R [Clostridia bacterium]